MANLIKLQRKGETVQSLFLIRVQNFLRKAFEAVRGLFRFLIGLLIPRLKISVYLVELPDEINWVVFFGRSSPTHLIGKFHLGPNINNTANNRYAAKALPLEEMRTYCRNMGWFIKRETHHRETIAVKN